MEYCIFAEVINLMLFTIMKKIALIIVLLSTLLSCSTSKFGSKSPVYMSNFRTLYDDRFRPYYEFSITNNTSKTITNFEVFVDVAYQNNSYIKSTSWKPVWDTSIPPGATKYFTCPTDFAEYRDFKLRKFEFTRARFSDGTIYKK